MSRCGVCAYGRRTPCPGQKKALFRGVLLVANVLKEAWALRALAVLQQAGIIADALPEQRQDAVRPWRLEAEWTV